jgi:hypothetical protein
LVVAFLLLHSYWWLESDHLAEQDPIIVLCSFWSGNTEAKIHEVFKIMIESSNLAVTTTFARKIDFYCTSQA